MKTFLLSFLIVATSLPLIVTAEPAIEILRPWVRTVPGSMTSTAAYFTIKNNTADAVQLTGGTTEIAKMCEPMVGTRREQDGQEVTGMRTVESLEIPAGGELELKPGGDHLMLMRLLRNPTAGDEVEIVLEFAPGDQKVVVMAPVQMEAPKP